MSVEMSDLIPPQEPQALASGFQGGEGPVWHPDGYLLFTDIPASTIYRWAPGSAAEPFISPSRRANGLSFDRHGRLVACEHIGRQVSRMGADGQMATVVDRYQGKRLNSPNDLVVHSSGSIYFTDPPYGVLPDFGELGFPGVYRIDQDGGIVLLVSDFFRPNGLAFSPDESILYIDDSVRRHIRAFDVQPDGSLTNDRVFVDMDVEAPGPPDGMKVDVEGNVYCTAGGGLWVMDAGGRHLGTYSLPENPRNVAFGGPDYKNIYLTAAATLFSIRGNVPGVRVL